MVPPIAGSHSVEAAIYLPKASSKIQSIRYGLKNISFTYDTFIFSHWFSGTSVNFADPKQIARANGRELVRVETVSIVLNEFLNEIIDYISQGWKNSSSISNNNNKHVKVWLQCRQTRNINE